jgi:hypothetical protein
VTPADIALALSSSSKLDAAITFSYLMTYLPSNNASFVFTETIKAKDFLGKEGSFITQGKGTFDSSTYVVEGTFQIVEGSGTGALGLLVLRRKGLQIYRNRGCWAIGWVNQALA